MLRAGSQRQHGQGSVVLGPVGKPYQNEILRSRNQGDCRQIRRLATPAYIQIPGERILDEIGAKVASQSLARSASNSSPHPRRSCPRVGRAPSHVGNRPSAARMTRCNCPLMNSGPIPAFVPGPRRPFRSPEPGKGRFGEGQPSGRRGPVSATSVKLRPEPPITMVSRDRYRHDLSCQRLPVLACRAWRRPRGGSTGAAGGAGSAGRSGYWTKVRLHVLCRQLQQEHGEQSRHVHRLSGDRGSASNRKVWPPRLLY